MLYVITMKSFFFLHVFDNYFGFDLGYDKQHNGTIGGQAYTNPQYNGNIEGMVWKSKSRLKKIIFPKGLCSYFLLQKTSI